MKKFNLIFSEEDIHNKISYSRHLYELWYKWWNNLVEYMNYFYDFINEFKLCWYKNDIVPYLWIAFNEIKFNRRLGITVQDIDKLQNLKEPPSLWLILKSHLYSHWKWEWYSRKLEQNIYNDVEIYYICTRYQICIENWWNEYTQSVQIVYTWENK